MLTTAPPALRPYAYLADGSAGRFMDRVAIAIADDAKALALLSHPQAQVMSDIKARVKSSGKPAIKALYWSVRCPDSSAWGGIRTRTLLAGPDRMEWIDFSHDPALPALATLQARPGSWQILRYVPLRRATLLHHPATGLARIVKVKRPYRAAEAARRLAAAGAALETKADFAMPRLLDTGPDGNFTQSLCRGQPLGAGFPNDVPKLLRRIGQMHARLHATAPIGLPPEQRPDFSESLNMSSALRPDLMPGLATLAEILRSPPGPTIPVLCHGDLGFDQILHDEGALSVVDFDLCHAGEAAADIARFLVALAETPLPELPPAAAEAAYLNGYAELRALPDCARLRWFRAEAVAAHLLVCLRKDQTSPDQLNRLLSQLDVGATA